MKTAKEIATEIFYKPATNGKAEQSILEGEKLILEYANQWTKYDPKDESTFPKEGRYDVWVQGGKISLIWFWTYENPWSIATTHYKERPSKPIE